MAAQADEQANQGKSTGAILYCCVANWERKFIIAEHTSSKETKHITSEVVTKNIVPNLKEPEQDKKMLAVKYGDCMIYSESFAEGFTVVHVTTNYRVEHSLLFSKNIYDEFKNAKCAPDTKNDSFAATIANQMRVYTDTPPVTKIDAVKAKQDQVKEVMIDTIEASIKRHGQIEVNLTQTESLKETSKQFQTKSKDMKRTAQCQLYKQYACFAAIALVIVGVLIIVICVAAKC